MKISPLVRPREVTAWDGDEVAAFDQGRKDILVMDRPPLPGIAETVTPARVQYWRSSVTVGTAEARAAEALGELCIANPVLAEDIVGLSRSFLAQFGVDEASLRVEVVDKQSCPKFHCDYVRVRLVTTYHGPTTEYVHIDAPEDVLAAPLFALVFLKGHQHPAHADAVHHRSPGVPPGGKRLCVILDV
ncbi:MAG: DUF1826 domain-containing protein [Planctomycetes bacterium]|nr:DUF1826 domain-containing protein [Planctomycetota bacterium]